MQTLERGSPLAARYGRLGGLTGKMDVYPGRTTAFIVGLPGEGKSAFLQSNPNAYIFNLDLSGTTSSTPKAALFPGVNLEGQPVSTSGSVVLTYQTILEKIAILHEMAAKNEPRPQTVVFDSLASWINLVRAYITENSVALGISANPVTEWRHLNGMSAYDTLYDMIVNTILSLQRSGYGVYVVGHIVNARVPVGEDRHKTKPELTITDNFWKRLYPIFGLVLYVYADYVPVERTRIIKQPVRGGGTQDIPIRETVTERRFFASVTKQDYTGLTKSRPRLPDVIPLPSDDAWASFEKIYNDAMSVQTP